MSKEFRMSGRSREIPGTTSVGVVAAFCFGLVFIPVPPPQPAQRVLEGEVAIEIRGPGAAPLGIASAVFGSTALAFNLGRIEHSKGAAEPINPIGAFTREVYVGSLRFELEQRRRRMWSARSFSMTYRFVDDTTFSEDQVVISDSMRATGGSRWQTVDGRPGRAGEWTEPAGWRPGFRPRIDLRTFEAPSVEACEDPGWGPLRMVRTLLVPEEQRVTCFELEILVAHPMNAGGSSVWESPIGEVRIDATDGVYRLSASSMGSEIAKNAGSMPLPPGTPPETEQAIRGMGALAAMTERFLGEGLPELDLRGPWTWERTYRGVLRDGGAVVRDVFPILTGATVFETARVGKGPIVDIYRDGERITDRTIDVVVGERVDLEGFVEMADGPVETWRWDVPGNPVERFEVTEESKRSKDCNDAPVDVFTAVRGRPDHLENEELNEESVSFLWWDQGRYRVSVRATAGGSNGSAEAWFNVEEPSVSLDVDIGREPTAEIMEFEQAEPCGRSSTRRELVVTAGYLAPEDGGGSDSGLEQPTGIAYAIRIRHEELPDKYAGETQYVQLVKIDGIWLKRKDIALGPYCNQLHTPFELDTTYPYATGLQMTDWPGAAISRRNTDLHAAIKMAFTTWLMYRPDKPDADWVPLRLVDWIWEGSATWNPVRSEYDIDGPEVWILGNREADRYPEWDDVTSMDWEEAECPPE